MSVAYGVCVGSWERFTANVAPRVVGPVMALSGQTSIADAYNTILNHYHLIDLLILQHDDLEITDPDGITKLAAAAAEPNVAIVGVAGARGVQSIAWWNYDRVGHQQTDGGMLDFGPRTGDVDALDGSLLAFTPWARKHLRFDRLAGFHGYDVLICAKALAAGKRVVVADVDTHHHTMPGRFKSDAGFADWQQAEQFYQEKVRGE